MDPVTTICYGTRREWSDRAEAIAFFREGALTCDGSERSRYLDILMGLYCGLSLCIDGEPLRR